MVFIRGQTENMSRDELVEELPKLLDVSSKPSELTEIFNNFVLKHDKVYSKLQISRNWYNHLLQKIIQLERNAVTNSRYHRRETLEKNLVPESLRDEILEEDVCKALFFVPICKDLSLILSLMLLQNSCIHVIAWKSKTVSLSN